MSQSTLRIGAASLNATQKKLQIAADNIAHAETPGRSRHDVSQKTLARAGKGVGARLETLSRRQSPLLLRHLNTERSRFGETSVLAQVLSDLQHEFGEPGSDATLTQRLLSFEKSLHELSAHSADSAARRSVVRAGQDIAEHLHSLSSAIQAARTSANASLATAAREVNAALLGIQEQNRQIALAQAVGASVAAYQDERDRLVAEVAKNIDIRAIEQPDGRLFIFTESGQLLLQSEAAQFSCESPESSLTAQDMYLPDGTGKIQPLMLNGIDATSSIRAGTMKGFIALRDKELPQIQQQFDVLAKQLCDMTNAIHNESAVPLRAVASRATFTPAAAVGTASGELSIALTDHNGIVTSHHVIQLDGELTPENIVQEINAQCANVAEFREDGHFSLANSTQGGKIALGGNARISGKGFSEFFGFNDFFVTDAGYSGAPVSLRVRPDIVGNPELLGSGSLQTSQQHPAVLQGDNSITRRLHEALSQNVHFFSDPQVLDQPEEPELRVPLVAYAGQLLSRNAERARAVSEQNSLQETRFHRLEERYSEETGISVEEILQEILALREAYQASAELMRVSQTMTDILLSAFRR